MEPVILLLFALCLGSGAVSGRYNWAAALNMVTGAALVLAMLVAEVPARWILLAALALGAETAFAGRKTR